MSDSIRPDRDRFALSLGGAASINSYTLVPAIADDLRQGRNPVPPRDVAASSSRAVRGIEDFLARYLAPGCREAI